MGQLIKTGIIFAMAGLVCIIPPTTTDEAAIEPTSVIYEVNTEVETEKIAETTIVEITTEEPILAEKPVEKKKKEKSHSLTNAEIDLIALITFAEAEGEPEKGKRLVIDTILNRMDHKRFPNTVKGVIYQKNQFSVVGSSRIKRSRVTKEIRKLVLEELESRTNYDVIFFRTKRYSKYGDPLFKVGNHYFSSY